MKFLFLLKVVLSIFAVTAMARAWTVIFDRLLLEVVDPVKVYTLGASLLVLILGFVAFRFRAMVRRTLTRVRDVMFSNQFLCHLGWTSVGLALVSFMGNNVVVAMGACLGLGLLLVLYVARQWSALGMLWLSAMTCLAFGFLHGDLFFLMDDWNIAVVYMKNVGIGLAGVWAAIALRRFFGNGGLAFITASTGIIVIVSMVINGGNYNPGFGYIMAGYLGLMAAAIGVLIGASFRGSMFQRRSSMAMAVCLLMAFSLLLGGCGGAGGPFGAVFSALFCPPCVLIVPILAFTAGFIFGELWADDEDRNGIPDRPIPLPKCDGYTWAAIALLVGVGYVWVGEHDLPADIERNFGSLDWDSTLRPNPDHIWPKMDPIHQWMVFDRPAPSGYQTGDPRPEHYYGTQFREFRQWGAYIRQDAWTWAQLRCLSGGKWGFEEFDKDGNGEVSWTEVFGPLGHVSARLLSDRHLLQVPKVDPVTDEILTNPDGSWQTHTLGQDRPLAVLGNGTVATTAADPFVDWWKHNSGSSYLLGVTLEFAHCPGHRFCAEPQVYSAEQAYELDRWKVVSCDMAEVELFAPHLAPYARHNAYGDVEVPNQGPIVRESPKWGKLTNPENPDEVCGWVGVDRCDYND